MNATSSAHDVRGWRNISESVGDRLGGQTALAWAGISGPLIFTACYMVQEAFRTEEYSPIVEPVSALEAGPNGWIQQVNFVVFGILTLAYAAGLHRGVRPTRRGVVGPALIAVSGIGLFLAAILPLREDAAGVTYDPGGHFVAGVTFFFSSAAGLVVLSRRLAYDDRWTSLSRYVLVSGIVAVGGFVTLGVLAIPDDAPLHDIAGLLQRIVILAVLFPCRVVLSYRMLKLDREPSPA
jgi:hypothetical membrane protein